jgi:CopG family nickel-responsive transcriptional regulator
VDTLVRFGVAVPSSLLDEFDSFIERKGMPNRSEALRQLIRERLSREMWITGDGIVYGTVTMMYDHHGKDTAGALTSLQHEYGESIICTTHVHVDHHHCLECIVLKGDVGQIRRFVEALASLKGVKSLDPSISAIL